MEAAVASTGSGLHCSPNPMPKQQHERRSSWAVEERSMRGVMAYRSLCSLSRSLLQRGVSTDELLNGLRELRVDFILLAGYLKLIPVELVQAYPKSILNIHPSLLPAFGGKGYYGLKVHKAVIASGARYSGPTVHFVDEHYDIGRTLAQRVVPVQANDTPEQLATRVLHEEHQVYVEAVTALCEDRIVWREDGIPLIRSQTNPDEYT
uniref:phosphoribosylglycinamide formyltransferase 1 n=1 Tax=Oryza barthii TaxID=65489 RepID=A0A0D3G5C0_9ORYZ